MQLHDNLGRKINYMRLSVTDRCNMRCRYCMPEEGVEMLNHEDVLSYEQLYLLAQSAVAVGIEKIRVTGGEPLVRKGIIDFLGRLSQLPGLKHLVLTTNGVNLQKMAGLLKTAGVQRLNISLDSLRPDVFASITRRDVFSQVMAGIEAAEQVGLPIKINMVVMRGINDAEIEDFASMTLEKKCSVRFIEYMPAIKENGWKELFLSGEDVLSRIAAKYSFSPVVKSELSGPAREYKIAGSHGTIGVITALSGHFCQDCNRVRITASGKVKTCLFAKEEYDLKDVLATGDMLAIQEFLRQQIAFKPAMHHLNAQLLEHDSFSMASVGG